MLPHVPFDGWTRRALRTGLADIGMAPEDAELLFPGGAADMIEAFCDLGRPQDGGRAPPRWIRRCGCTNGCAR